MAKRSGVVNQRTRPEPDVFLINASAECAAGTLSIALSFECWPHLLRGTCMVRVNLEQLQYIQSDRTLTIRNATDRQVWLDSNLKLLKRTQALEEGMQAEP